MMKVNVIHVSWHNSIHGQSEYYLVIPIKYDMWDALFYYLEYAGPNKRSEFSSNITNEYYGEFDNEYGDPYDDDFFGRYEMQVLTGIDSVKFREYKQKFY